MPTTRRRPRIHGHAAGLRFLQRRAPLRLRDLPQPEEGAARQEAQHGRGRRRWFRPRSEGQRRSVRCDPHRHREGRLQAGRASLVRPGLAQPPSSTTAKKKVYTIDGKELDSAGMVDFWPAGSRSIRSARSKTAAAKTTGKAGNCSPTASATSANSSATTCLSPTSSGCNAASTKGSPTAFSSR